ncbi:hypothetical protein [Caenibius tardaugens]|uniref:hypothetical protein n=1 Tax=Caenibius tardaugens TaxID=169176 RepID=UPI0004264F78|nr:hypothetical protein [Caenibius tardaugens]AZI35117.1 hypothetical protein EGO55_03385 [Caenibius tardaugens NBRC 16725]
MQTNRIPDLFANFPLPPEIRAGSAPKKATSRITSPNNRHAQPTPIEIISHYMPYYYRKMRIYFNITF